jgi:hypothetical protein
MKMAKAMTKEVQMSIKMERGLREAFLAAAAREHRPAAQMIREYMWSVVEGVRVPNAETIAAMEEVERGEVFRAKDVNDFCRQLGIPCEK